MKHTITFMMLVLLTLGGAMATPVGSQRARQTAESFWQAQGLKGALTEQATEFTHLHLFVGVEGGFVVVSGDDCARPVLAWSADAPTADTLHPAMRYWLDGYDRQIARAMTLGVQTSPEWRSPKSGSVTTVGPLLTTRWDQGEYYNDQCPLVGGEHCVTGCVATATAQVMKYWNWPTTGRGSYSYTCHGTQSANFGATTYAWSQMPDELTAASTTAQVAAVAQLMYHVGVAVGMAYDIGESSASYLASEEALKVYFDYSNNVRSLSRSAFSQAEWMAVVKAELDSLRPILYRGSSSTAGHAFVCDGYDSHDRMHINWGWGGYCDGWFFCDALDPAGSGIGGNAESSYNLNQGIIIGIEPDSSAYNPSAQYTVSLSATTGGTVSGGGTYAVGTYVNITATPATGYRFDRWSDGVGLDWRYQPIYANMNLTANFVSVAASDTLQLDNGVWYFYDNDTTGAMITRSVTFPASLMAGRQRLTAVMYFAEDTGMHTVTVSHGSGLTYTKSERPLSPGFWNTMYLNDTIALNTQNDITVSLTAQKVVMMVGGWGIRAISDGLVLPHRLRVLSNNVHGYVTGGGDYSGDTTVVTLTAVVADSGYLFYRWSDGNTDNPRSVTLVSDSTFTAEFASGIYYLNVIVNDTTLGYVPAVNGWHSRDEYDIGDLQGAPHIYDPNVGLANHRCIGAHPYPHAVCTGWRYRDPSGVWRNCDSNPIYLYSLGIYPGATDIQLFHPDLSIIGDTLMLEAVFEPVRNGDILQYYSNLLETYKLDSHTDTDTTTYYRWGVKFDPSTLGGVTEIPRVKAYLMCGRDSTGYHSCTYNVQLWQGEETGTMTMLATKACTVHNDAIDGPGWRSIVFDSPVAIDSTQPLWVVINCTHTPYYTVNVNGIVSYWRPHYGSTYYGNPNSNYIWTAATGWTHAMNPVYGDPEASWAIRAYTAPGYYVEAVADGDSCGTATGSGLYPVGTTATLTAIPDEHHCFKEWRWANETGATYGGWTQSLSNPVTFTVNDDVRYKAVFKTQAEVYTLYSEGGYATGAGTYTVRDTATLHAVADNHFIFDHWEWRLSENPSATGTSTDNPVSFAVTADVYYTPHFVPQPTVHVHWNTAGDGYGNINYSADQQYVGNVYSYYAGTTVTLTAVPLNSNYAFARWEWHYDADPSTVYQTTDNPVSITATEDVTYTAVFMQKVFVSTETSPSYAGQVTGGGSYLPGETITLRATPYSNFTFDHWEWNYWGNYYNGDHQSTANPVTFTATHSVTYKAVFTASTQTVNITVRSNNNAWGTVSGDGTYQTGQTAVLTATPTSGHHFLYWKYDNTDMEIEENPFYLTVMAGMAGNYTLIGYFAMGAGIGDITEDGINIYSRDGQIVVEGAEGEEVKVYDMMGREVFRASHAGETPALPGGVYMVKVGNYPARRVVVIR